jgi:hypothetical protein
MPLVVPLDALLNQTVAITLGRQYCRINVYARAHCGVVVDVLVMDALIVGGVIAHDRTRIVRNAYLGFEGELAFVDQAGREDPDWRELGTRWPLLWWPPEELP